MLPRARRIVVTLAATAALAGGAVAHAAMGSSGSAAESTSTPAVADSTVAAGHARGDCPNMGGDRSTPSATPSTTPSTGSSAPSTSTTNV